MKTLCEAGHVWWPAARRAVARDTITAIRCSPLLHGSSSAAEALQTEAFGNCSLLVIAEDLAELRQAIDQLEGNLTGCVYSDTAGSDDAAYDRIAPPCGSAWADC